MLGPQPRRLFAAACLAAAVMTLVLSGCGSSEPETSPMREKFISQLRADAASDGAPAEQVDCVVNGLSQLSDEQLQSWIDGSPSEEVSATMGSLFEACTGDS